MNVQERKKQAHQHTDQHCLVIRFVETLRILVGRLAHYSSREIKNKWTCYSPLGQSVSRFIVPPIYIKFGLVVFDL